jgi:uncharacterized membrane protein
MPNWANTACVAAVIVLAIGSLPVALSHMSHSVWHDEAQTHLIARQDTLAGVASMAMTERPYPPLFFFAVHYSLLARDDEVGLRLPAALFGSLAILAVFLLGSALADRPTGAVAAYLFALTPGAFRYFVDSNAYALLMLTSALSTLCLWRAAQSDSVRDWALYAASALAGLSTHSLFVFHLAGQAAAGVYLRSRIQHAPRRHYRRLACVLSLLFVILALWAWFYMKSGGEQREVTTGRVLEPSTLLAIAGMYAGAQSFGSLAQLFLWGALQALGVVALWRTRRSLLPALVILVVVPLAAIPVFAKLTLPFVAYRYGLGIFPLACVVAACSWKALPERQWVRPGVVLVILAYWVGGATFIVSARENTFGYQDWRAAARHLSARWSPGDSILVPGSYGLLPFSYYWKGPRPLNPSNEPQAIGESLGPILPAQNAVERRAWVLLGTFANDNAVVARYTESWRPDPANRLNVLTGELVARGLHVCQTAAFRRVEVLEIRRGSCQEAP